MSPDRTLSRRPQRVCPSCVLRIWRSCRSLRHAAQTSFSLILIIALLTQPLLAVATARPLAAAPISVAGADPIYSPILQEEPIPPDEEPIDGLGTDDTAPLEPPIEEPAAAPSPVSLTLSSRKGTLTPNSASQLTVNVRANQAIEAGLLTLQVELPATLESAGQGGNSILEWSLPAMDEGEEFSEKFVLKVIKNPGQLPQAATVVATVDGKELAQLSVFLDLGILEQRGGQPDPAPHAVQGSAGAALTNEYEDVSLIVPVDAAAEGTLFTYEPLYDWQDGESAAGSVTTATAAKDDAIEAKKPPKDPKGRDVGEVRVYKHFKLTAATGEEVLSQLDDEVAIDIDVAELIAQGVDLTGFNIWTRESEAGVWRVVPSAYDGTELHFRAWTSHFTEFSLGQGLTSTGNGLPSVKAFSVDQLTGAAQASIAIETPAGLGGMSPSLALSYSSAEMDDQRNQSGDWNQVPGVSSSQWRIVRQESSVGTGWSLGGVSYIANNGTFNGGDNSKRFTLVLNGQSVTITCVKQLNPWDGRCFEWRTTPEMFAKIEWSGDKSGGGDYGAEDFAMWKITTTDGRVYEFGDTGAFNFNPNSSATKTSAVSTLLTGGSLRYASRWYLRSVTDPLGNRMEYSYQQEYAHERDCVDRDWINSGHNWYTRAVYPTQIRWSGRANGNPGYRMRVNFQYGTRFDNASLVRIYGEDNSDCVMPNYGLNDELKDIHVQVRESSGAWRTVRTYHMNYWTKKFTRSGRLDQYRRILSSVQQKGKNSAGILQTHSFAYNIYTPNKYFLYTVNNGWGGVVRYYYGGYKVACSGAVCRYGNQRHAVTQRRVEDGLGNTSKTTYYRGPYTPANGSEWGARADDGAFLGFKEVHITHYDVNSWTALRYESAYSFTGGSTADRYNPDPRRGRIRVSRVCNKRCDQSGRVIYENSVNDYKIFWKERNFSNSTPSWVDKTSLGDTWYWRSGTGSERIYPGIWVRQESVTVSDNKGASNQQIFGYDKNKQGGQQFGNVTNLKEYGDNVFLRETVTDYIPNTGKNIVSAPARVKIFKDANQSRCVSEMRMIYGGNGLGSHYRTQPQNTLLVKTEKALSWCSNNTTSYHSNNSWAVTYSEYDGWGNVKKQTAYGTGGSNNSVLTTTYDSVFRLFPISQSMGGQTETAKYYGVNTPYPWHTLNANGAFFGGMAEHCGVNGVCSRQTYDGFGRAASRWDAVVSSTSWGGVGYWGSVQTKWGYSSPDASHSTYMVVEQRQPFSQGNFVRRHYDGIGQLVLEQTPYQNWALNGSTATGNEIHVNYQYDGLGREMRTSAPRLMGTRNYTVNVNWSAVGHTRSTYDGRGRIYDTYAPNGQKTQYRYGRRAVSTVLVGMNGDGGKLVNWRQTDAMGNLQYVRSYRPNGSGWAYNTLVWLGHDVMGNLTHVSQASNTGTTWLYYDLAGRKTKMTDPDLGTWTYAYDRKGNLIRQTDARNKSACLGYDTLNRLRYKRFQSGTACPGLSASNSHEEHLYGSSGTSKGQLIRVRYPNTNYGSYQKNIYYDSKGRLQRERVVIGGAPSIYNTYSYYDSYSRPYRVRYPDGESVYTYFTGMGGLPYRLYSTSYGTLVDSVTYDAAGRLTRMRMPRGTDLWRRQYYHSWAGQSSDKRNGNGLLSDVRVGTYNGSVNRLHLTYKYDTFANIRQLTERYNNGGTSTHNLGYDHQNRVSSAFGKGYSWQHAGNFTVFEGKSFTYDSRHRHAVDRVNGANRYDYDANGNMSQRRIGQTSRQALYWDYKNHLSRVYNYTTRANEYYWYDADGMRIRKRNGSAYTFYPNAFYEVQTGGSMTAGAYRLAAENPEEMSYEEWAAQLDAELEQLLGEEKILALEAEQNPEAEKALANGDPSPAEDVFIDEHPGDAYKSDEELVDVEDFEDAPDIVSDEESETPAELSPGIAAAEHHLFLPVISGGGDGVVEAAAANATTIKKYYYFNGMRIGVGGSGGFRYLHADHLGGTVMQTNYNGTRYGELGYSAYGAQRRSAGSALTTDHKFTGQKLDGTGLQYFNARYYDPEIGQFISPDAFVPDPTNLFDYNRYMYARGNPLKYSDPSGHYSNDEIMQHYGCDDWGCVEAMFGGGGQFNGMWGWLYTLQQAENGYQVTSTSIGAGGRGDLRGAFQRSGSGSISVTSTGLEWNGTKTQFAANFDDFAFASYAARTDIGFYHLSGGGAGLATGARQKHNYLSFDPSGVDKTGLALAALSAGTDIGPVTMAASPSTGLAAPFVFAGGLAYTLAGVSTDLVVDVIIPINEAMKGNTAPAWETIIVEGGARFSGKAGPFIGPAYDAGKAILPAVCYGTNCR